MVFITHTIFCYFFLHGLPHRTAPRVTSTCKVASSEGGMTFEITDFKLGATDWSSITRAIEPRRRAIARASTYPTLPPQAQAVPATHDVFISLIDCAGYTRGAGIQYMSLGGVGVWCVFHSSCGVGLRCVMYDVVVS